MSNDPARPDLQTQVYLAAERTFLAWIRTSLALLAGGIGLEAFLTAELPAVLDELSAEARGALLEYVQELRDWVAGILKWHRDCRRYGEEDLRAQVSSAPVRVGALTGLGTSAARHLVS